MTGETQSAGADDIIIRDLDASVVERLRERAQRSGRSEEDEVLAFLAQVIGAPPASSEPNLSEAIRACFEPLRSVEFELPLRGPVREPPQFE